MKAWLLDEFAGVEKLRLGTTTDPTPAAGQVVLDVVYAALNPADRYLAEGQYPARPPLPHILGRDGVGVVNALGAGVAGVPVGAKMVVLRGETGVTAPGTFAEKVAVSADSLVPVPSGWSDREASCAALVYLTAYQALTQWNDLPSSAIVLITGASGGVGVATVQLAKAMGHIVVALSRDAEKQARLRDLGADVALDPADANWKRAARDATGRKVDLAVDNIGGPFFSDLLDTLGDHGRVSCVGRLAGPTPQFNTATLFFRRIKIGGVAVGAYVNAESHAAWSDIRRLLAKTNAKPLIDSVHPFEELPSAFARLARGPMGKVLLAVTAN